MHLSSRVERAVTAQLRFVPNNKTFLCSAWLFDFKIRREFLGEPAYHRDLYQMEKTGARWPAMVARENGGILLNFKFIPAPVIILILTPKRLAICLLRMHLGGPICQGLYGIKGIKKKNRKYSYHTFFSLLPSKNHAPLDDVATICVRYTSLLIRMRCVRREPFPTTHRISSLILSDKCISARRSNRSGLSAAESSNLHIVLDSSNSTSRNRAKSLPETKKG